MQRLKDRDSEYDSSRLQRRENARARSASNSSNYLEVTEYVISLHPAESRELMIKVRGPLGHHVVLDVVGFPWHVAQFSSTSIQGFAPFTSSVLIVARATALPGVYPWSIVLRDAEGASLDHLQMSLVILPRALSKEYYEKLKILYKSYGIQLALWIALKISYPLGANFSVIKGLYEALVSSRISKGTVGNTLRLMVLKGLVEKLDVGLYKPAEINLNEALARINIVRVRTCASINLISSDKTVKEGRLGELPIEIRKYYNIAREISQDHGPLAALYFLLYTLLGARKTGFLLLWQGHWFIVCEPKTHFCHHYYSALLNSLLCSLGLYNGVYYPVGKEHEEARKIAEKYLHEHFGGYKEARRLHYLLREEGYISQKDPNPYTLRVYHYEDGSVGVDIYDRTGRELELGVNVENKPVLDIETWIALPLMHIDKRNEETYF